MADQEPDAGGNGASMRSLAPGFDPRAICEGPFGRESQRSAGLFRQLQPQLDVQFNMSVNAAGDGAHEVALKFDISARSDNGVHFVIDLSYAGLSPSATYRTRRSQPFLLIEAPRLLFPFARQIIAEAISSTRLPSASSRSDRFRFSLYGAGRRRLSSQAGIGERRRAGRRNLRQRLTLSARRGGS